MAYPNYGHRDHKNGSKARRNDASRGKDPNITSHNISLSNANRELRVALIRMHNYFDICIKYLRHKCFWHALIGQLGGNLYKLFTSWHQTARILIILQCSVTEKEAFCAIFSTRVVNTKTIIHLGVGESGRYLLRSSANILHYLHRSQ